MATIPRLAKCRQCGANWLTRPLSHAPLKKKRMAGRAWSGVWPSGEKTYASSSAPSFSLYTYPCAWASNARLRSITAIADLAEGVVAAGSDMKSMTGCRMAASPTLTGPCPAGNDFFGGRCVEIRQRKRAEPTPMHRPAPRPVILLLMLVAALATASTRAQTTPAPASLRLELERLYASWKSAMVAKDLTAWAKTTSRAQQMMVRNTIVSQKRDWPRSLFSLAMLPPDLDGLRLAGSQAVGDQARLIYYGRIDFRIDDTRSPPDNALVLDFVREGGVWRYFVGRYFNLRNDPALARRASTGDMSFLGTEHALTGQAPAVPKPCPHPDYAGQLRVSSFGYTTRVQLGEFHNATITGRTSTDMITGGLNKGPTPLTVTVQPLPDVPGRTAQS